MHTIHGYGCALTAVYTCVVHMHAAGVGQMNFGGCFGTGNVTVTGSQQTNIKSQSTTKNAMKYYLNTSTSTPAHTVQSIKKLREIILVL